MAKIAERAGVHVTTVSLALRNHPRLPPATRQRIQLLAEKMGYRPDPALSSLVAYRMGNRPRKNEPVLAYITNWNDAWSWKAAPAHADFYAGATAKASALGYQLEHFWLGEPGLSHQRMSDILYNRSITGLIIASHREGADASLKFDWSRFSAVRIDHLPHEPALHHVTNNQRAIVQLAMRRVMTAGYQRIGLVLRADWDTTTDLAWSAGFLAEQQKIPGSRRIPPLFFPNRLGAVSPDQDLFETWFRLHRPEVLIGYGPSLLPRLAAMGLAVPRDVAFVDVLLGEPDGRIAGVRQNCQRVGELAVQILVGQLHQNIYGLPPFATATLVDGTWIDGKSLPLRTPAPSGGHEQRRDQEPGRQTRSKSGR